MGKGLFLKHLAQLKTAKNAPAMLEEMSKWIPLNVRLGPNKTLLDLTGKVRSSVDELIALVADGKSLEAMAKIMTPADYIAFKNLPENIRIFTKEIPKNIFIENSLLKKIDTITVPTNEASFYYLVKTDKRIQSRFSVFVDKLQKRSFIAKLMIGGAVAGGIFGLLDRYAQENSGCYIFTVHGKKVSRCKDTTRSCGKCSSPGKYPSCNPNLKVCSKDLECCHDCKTEDLTETTQRRCIQMDVIDALQELTSDFAFQATSFFSKIIPFLQFVFVAAILFGISYLAKIYFKR